MFDMKVKLSVRVHLGGILLGERKRGGGTSSRRREEKLAKKSTPYSSTRYRNERKIAWSDAEDKQEKKKWRWVCATQEKAGGHQKNLMRNRLRKEKELGPRGGSLLEQDKTPTAKTVPSAKWVTVKTERTTSADACEGVFTY